MTGSNTLSDVCVTVRECVYGCILTLGEGIVIFLGFMDLFLQKGCYWDFDFSANLPKPHYTFQQFLDLFAKFLACLVSHFPRYL